VEFEAVGLAQLTMISSIAGRCNGE
jgi:hypothetical protein